MTEPTMSRPLHSPGRRLLLAAGLSATLSGVAYAQPYPARPIRLVVPYPPGGPLDLAARALAESMREPLGQVIVDRKSTRLNSSHVSESRMPSSA